MQVEVHIQFVVFLYINGVISIIEDWMLPAFSVYKLDLLPSVCVLMNIEHGTISWCYIQDNHSGHHLKNQPVN